MPCEFLLPFAKMSCSLVTPTHKRIHMIFIMNGLSDFPRAQELSPSRRHTHAYAQIYLGFFYLCLFIKAPFEWNPIWRAVEKRELVSKLAAQKKWSEKQKNQFSTWLLATSIRIACFTHAGENMDIIINAYNFPLPKKDSNSLLSLMKIICHQNQKATPCGNRCSLFPTCFPFSCCCFPRHAFWYTIWLYLVPSY